MPGGHHIRAHFLSGLQESVELYLPIAQHVRVRRSSLGVFIEHIVHHPLTVFIAQVNEIERDTYFPRDHFGHEFVFFPFAVTVQCPFRVVPVLHEHRKNIVTLLFEQQSGNTGVHTSG